jgi:uncharacterized protein (TIGR03067 family)
MTNHYILLAALLWATPLSGSVANYQANPNPLVGQWRAVSGEFAGQALPPRDLPTSTLTFEKDGRWRDSDGAEATWITDESTSPKRLELAHTAGRDLGKKQLCVFEVAGDRLTIVFGIPGGTVRPMALKTSKDNTNVVLLVFERVKPKDPAGKDTGTR